jgi:hypothetical protein
MKNKAGIPILYNSNNSSFNNAIDYYQYTNGNKICSRFIVNLFGINLFKYHHNVQKK